VSAAIEHAPADRRVAEAATGVSRELEFSFAPRVRVEWLIAGTRVILATGGLLAVIVDPLQQPIQAFVVYLLGWYLTYSLAMLALVWAPIRFAPGWGLAVYLFDFVAFTLLVVATRAAASPFFLCFLFLLVCGTLRWQVKGTLWTAAAVFFTYAGISFYAANVLFISGFDLDTFVLRSVYIAVITAMLTVLSAHHHRFQREIGQIAGWPRHVDSDSRTAVSEVLSQVGALLDAPLVLLAWTEVGEDNLKLAWLRGGETKWAEGTRTEYDPLVLAGVDGKSFQASDASNDRGLVIVHSDRGFRRRDGRPINEALRSRFQIRAVQSWPIEGELIRGRLFSANKIRMGIDDLVVGELVAGQVASRLDSTLMLGRLRDAATLEERVRVAGDLHDSLLQAQAGAALQLLAARRLLDRRPEAARQRLEEVQNLLERGELEMRSFIRGLRPQSSKRPQSSTLDLAGRLEALRLRVQRQWPITVTLQLNGGADRVPEPLREDVYHLVQEGIINAARHADASVVIVDLSITATGLRIEVADDGRGFSFRGTFDLQTLNRMKTGPLTLKERVGRLSGDLTISSLDTGTVVIMTLPISSDTH
jgi:signal transduction histidine kinase